MKDKLTLQELELLNTASAYNGEQHKTICGKAALELIEYKKIEKKLGTDLITLFKALEQDGVWVKEHNTKEQEIVFERVRLNFLNGTLDFVEPRKEIGKGRNLFDCGKTWALTKEELK